MMNYHEKNRSKFLNSAAIRGATCLLALSFCSLAQAGVEVYARGQGTAAGHPFQTSTAPTGSVSVSGSGSGNGYSTAAEASAGFGLLRAYSEAHAPFNGSGLSVNSGTTVYFRDDYLFNAQGKTGQGGTFYFTLHIDGSLSATQKVAGLEDPTDNGSRSYAQVGLSVLKDEGAGVSTVLQRERLFADGTREIINGAFLNQTNTFAVPFTFGTSFELKVQLSTITNARRQFGADSVSDIGHTLTWGGIALVNDSSNNAVSNYTLAATSGTNYTQAIPEPGTWVLTAGGLLTFLGARHVRRRAHKAV